MKLAKTVVVMAQPEHEKQVHDKTICDLCKQIITKDGSHYVSDVEVSYELGASYPEGGHTNLIEFDICPLCFMSKLVPWLESNGAKPTRTERDW